MSLFAQGGCLVFILLVALLLRRFEIGRRKLPGPAVLGNHQIMPNDLPWHLGTFEGFLRNEELDMTAAAVVAVCGAENFWREFNLLEVFHAFVHAHGHRLRFNFGELVRRGYLVRVEEHKFAVTTKFLDRCAEFLHEPSSSLSHQVA